MKTSKKIRRRRRPRVHPNPPQFNAPITSLEIPEESCPMEAFISMKNSCQFELDGSKFLVNSRDLWQQFTDETRLGTGQVNSCVHQAILTSNESDDSQRKRKQVAIKLAQLKSNATKYTGIDLKISELAGTRGCPQIIAYYGSLVSESMDNYGAYGYHPDFIQQMR